MTPLRKKFIEDMILAGYSTSTMEHYVQYVVQFVKFCNNTPPERITEEEVDRYVRHMLFEKKSLAGRFNRAFTLSKGCGQVGVARLGKMRYTGNIEVKITTKPQRYYHDERCYVKFFNSRRATVS